MNFITKVKEIERGIVRWDSSGEQFLSIISVPYNSSSFFIDIIMNCVRQNRNVIYITDEEPNNIDIIKNIKKYTDFRDYAYIKKPENNVNCLFEISSFHNALKLKKKFQLVIYDDINSFSVYDRYEIINLIDRLIYKNGKVIVYSIENIFGNGRELFLPISKEGPIVEPRTILTRFDMNKDIPFVVYDYLKWSLSEGRKAIIYVPDEFKVANVYSYIHNYCKNLCKNIIYFIEEESGRKSMNKFFQVKDSILITDSFRQIIANAKNSDIMVYFADNADLSYKKFVYLCGSIKRGEMNVKGEVIMVANLETEDMEQARNITRNFNREAWDMGLLKS
ncbi:MAG: hypothetical protein LKJ66_08405 [Clostridium luticellarii]|jgi:late competence protein required for DNA uptake (superfamily II DNA/RNA helicase)|nr:hypothetical protein [Clostridium luticellarii]MCI1995795.1 hypothetical protein [Clostridium luticellarii]MCI2040089.1 hypothetical protein [Clostridium luticellarii]